MVKPRAHPWTLVGPWYRWPEPGVKASGRQTAPVLQKYASAEFVSDFLAEPQRSLVPIDDDFVHEVRAGGTGRYSLSSLSYVKADPERAKVFLDTHGRFYLVVCELHCDVVGFPPVSRDQVGAAGFVVRRRKARVPGELLDRVEDLLGDLQKAKAEVAQLAGLGSARRFESSFEALIAESLEARQESRKGKAELRVAAKRAELNELAREKGIRMALEGWLPSEHEGVGSWQEVDERPKEVEETVFPLYPLVPDPGAESHSAAGRTLFFGVLPVSSADTDAKGNPRFDDRSLYEVRCFVERPRPGCPPELVWSRPTGTYQLASHTDLTGTSNKPTTIQLPDLKALEAQASGLPFGQGMGVAMVSPPDSSLQFQADNDDIMSSSAGTGGFQICWFSIPLITIVATFVLKLFLPIVVFLFGLWFLLKLKLCILPSLSIDAGLSADLEADMTLGVDIDASLEARVDGAFGFGLGAEVGGELAASLDANAKAGLLMDMSTDFSGDVDPALRSELAYADHIQAGMDAEFPNGRAEVAGELPVVTAGLEYYPVLEVPAP